MFGSDNFYDQLSTEQVKSSFSHLPIDDPDSESAYFTPYESEDENLSDLSTVQVSCSLLDFLGFESSLHLCTNNLDDVYNGMFSDLSRSEMVELAQPSLLQISPIESKVESYSSFAVEENMSCQSLTEPVELVYPPLRRSLVESESESEYSTTDDSDGSMGKPMSAICLRIDSCPFKPILPEHIRLNICHICGSGPITYRWKYGAIHCPERDSSFMRECHFSRNLREENERLMN